MAQHAIDPEKREWWTAGEIARKLGTVDRTVRDWASDPELIRMGGVIRKDRFLRFHWPTVQRWLREKTLERAPLAAVDDRAMEMVRREQAKRRGRKPKWLQAMERRIAG